MEPSTSETANGAGEQEKPRTNGTAKTPVKTDARKGSDERIVLYSYPPLVYIWPIIVLGFLFWFTDKFGVISPKTEAWVYMITLVVVLLTMGIDVNRNMAVFWTVVIAAMSFCVLWLRGAKGFLLFDHVGQFFAGLKPEYSPHLGMVTSIFLTVIYAIMLVGARINDKWVFTQNEIEHYALFRGTNSLGRGAKGVRATYRDFFELMVLLAGDIEVRTAQGNRVLARMQNVPFLVLKMRKIDRILASYSVTPGAADEESSEPVEEEVL